MKGKRGSSAEEGVLVWEAAKRWVPAELWQRYEQLGRDDAYEIFIVGPDVVPDRQQEEAGALRTEIVQILIGRLTTGELVASGIESPVRDLRNPRQDIAPELWPFLDLCLSTGEATGPGGLKLIGLTIRRASSSKPCSSASEQDDGCDLSTPEENGRRRRGGPRTLMPLVQAEMAARAVRGELLPTLAAESRFLEKWVKTHHPEFGRPPKAKSIGEALRNHYKQFKEKSDTGN